MSQLLRAEWLKMRKRWMPRVLLLIMLAIIALLFWGGGTSESTRLNLILPRGWLLAILYTTFLAPFLWPVLAGSWSGNEYGWGTIRLVLSRRPSREQYVLAGLAVLLATVLIAFVATAIIATIAGPIVAALTNHASFTSGVLNASWLGVLLKTILAAWLINAFYVVLAFTAGTIFRSGAVGIGVGIGLNLAQFVVTGIFFGLGSTWRDIAQHFPTAYTNALATRVAAEGFTSNFMRVGADMPGAVESTIALLIYTIVPIVATLILIRARDVTA